MQIGITGSTSTVNYDVRPPRQFPGAPNGIVCDNVHTSSQALMLSRSLAALREQLLPRNEMLEKHCATLETPVELDDRDLDSLIGSL